jgi:hypothetical protein
MQVLREISSDDTAMWLKVGVGLALMGLSFPGRRLQKVLGPLAFVAGIELVAWALLRHPFFIAATVVVLLVLVVVALLEKRPASAGMPFGKKPKIVSGEVVAFRRDAQGSRQPNDLQVVYAKVRNARDGGGETATLANAEAWMQAFDEDGNRVGSCMGNWMTLRAGVPDQPVKTVTLRPTSEEFALEIGGKFLWGEDAWLAGETHPSLKPGAYRIRASVSDGIRKAKVFEWRVTNPGAGKGLLVDGTLPREPSPATLLAGGTGPSTATSYVAAQPTQEFALEHKATEQQQASEREDELHPRAHQDPGKPPEVGDDLAAFCSQATELIERGKVLLARLASGTGLSSPPSTRGEINKWCADVRALLRSSGVPAPYSLHGSLMAAQGLSLMFASLSFLRTTVDDNLELLRDAVTELCS